MGNVSVLTRTMCWVLLALWLPVTCHCTLERLPGMYWLQCCCSDDSTAQGPSDCGEKACGSVESGAFKVEDPDTALSMPLVLVAFVLPLVDEPVVGRASQGASFGPAPPELPHIWQFCFRTALPPRAPSFVS